MKKLFLTLLLSAFLVTGTQAQIIIGLKGGLNFATMSNGESWENKTAFHAGAYLIYMLNDKLGLMPELLYSAQGSDYSDLSFEGSWNLDYLLVPLLLRYMIISNLYAVAGVQLGFLLSAEDEYNFVGSPETFTDDIKDNMNSMDVGLVIGAMYQITRFHIFARYILGVTDADDFDVFESSSNRVVQVGVGFDLKTE